jgi:hypothetical protein
MKLNPWTIALISAGMVTLPSAARAEEQPGAVLTALSSTTLSGYVDTSAIWKFGTGNGFIPGRAFDGGEGNPGGNKLDGFNLNVVKLALEKPLDEAQWAAGYRVDLLFGPDAVGYNTSANALDMSDFSVQQAYVAFRAPIGNGIDLKLGSWSTILGYEVFESGANANYSRSFGWQLEPTQHTGLLAEYTLNDVVALAAGVANTHVAGINLRSPRAESHKTYMGAVTLTAPETFGFLHGGTLSAGFMDGFAGDAGRDTTSLYAGASLPTPVEGLALGVAFDYRFNGVNDLTPADSGSGNWAYAVALYASFQATDKLAFHARADYTEGSDGTWYDAGVPEESDRQNRLGSLTFTADYSLWANLLSRVELRWDRSLRGDRPYNDGRDRNAVTLAANLVYSF